jgi:hypothetical protein
MLLPQFGVLRGPSGVLGCDERQVAQDYRLLRSAGPNMSRGGSLVEAVG